MMIDILNSAWTMNNLIKLECNGHINRHMYGNMNMDGWKILKVVKNIEQLNSIFLLRNIFNATHEVKKSINTIYVFPINNKNDYVEKFFFCIC